MEGKMGRNVYELDLHGKKLTKVEGLEQYTTLRVLDLSCNELEQIEGLDKNRDLRELKLYGNRITSLGGLESLSEVCHLQLQHNLLRKLGKSLLNLKKLRVLRLDHNQLEVISSNEIAPCSSHMTHLDLSCNRLTSVQGLGAIMNLEELKLSSNQLSDIPDLSRCKKLMELDVSSNPLGPGTLLKLKNKQLKILRIEHLHLEDLATSLPKLSQLEELHVAGNNITSTAALPGLYPRLEVLDLRENRIQTLDSLKSLGRLEVLNELQLESNPLCSDSENYRTAVRELLPNLEIIDGVSSNVAMGTVGAGRMLPLMRPLTPSSIGPSLHQMEHQLLEAQVQLENFTSGVSANFEMMRSQPVALLPSQKVAHHGEIVDLSFDSKREGCEWKTKEESGGCGSREKSEEKRENCGSKERDEEAREDRDWREMSEEERKDYRWSKEERKDYGLRERGNYVSREDELSNGYSGCDVVHGWHGDGGKSDETISRPSTSCSSRPSTRGSSRARIEEALTFATENFRELKHASQH